MRTHVHRFRGTLRPCHCPISPRDANVCVARHRRQDGETTNMYEWYTISYIYIYILGTRAPHHIFDDGVWGKRGGAPAHRQKLVSACNRSSVSGSCDRGAPSARSTKHKSTIYRIVNMYIPSQADSYSKKLLSALSKRQKSPWLHVQHDQ